MPEATSEQEVWTQGYDACRQHVRQQRLPQLYEAIDTLVAVGGMDDAAAATLKLSIRVIFSDLGFPFAGPDRITDAFSPNVNKEILPGDDVTLVTAGDDSPRILLSEDALVAHVVCPAQVRTMQFYPIFNSDAGGRGSTCPSCGNLVPWNRQPLNSGEEDAYKRHAAACDDHWDACTHPDTDKWNKEHRSNG